MKKDRNGYKYTFSQQICQLKECSFFTSTWRKNHIQAANGKKKGKRTFKTVWFVLY